MAQFEVLPYVGPEDGVVVKKTRRYTSDDPAANSDLRYAALGTQDDPAIGFILILTWNADTPRRDDFINITLTESEKLELLSQLQQNASIHKHLRDGQFMSELTRIKRDRPWRARLALWLLGYLVEPSGDLRPRN